MTEEQITAEFRSIDWGLNIILLAIFLAITLLIAAIAERADHIIRELKQPCTEQTK